MTGSIGLPVPFGDGTVVIGVDVGGSKKGFHAVSMVGGHYHSKFRSPSAAEIAFWCRQQSARAIGIDAPCHWSDTGRARCCERQLMKEGIWCFSTPSRGKAVAHPTGHYDWMLAGADLFEELSPFYQLFDGRPCLITEPVVFETFPQAVACALAGSVVSAKQKRSVRSRLLNLAGIQVDQLSSIDYIDAALCALAAQRLVERRVRAYGELKTGFIVVPV